MLRWIGLRVVAAGTLTVAQLVGPVPLVPAVSAIECGPVVANAATCTPAGNPYATGITYNSATMTLNVSSGVAIVGNPSAIGIWLQGSGAQTLNMAPGTSITTTGGNDAVLIHTGSSFPTGPVTVNAAGTTVSVSGELGYGWDLFSQGALTATVGDVTVGGNGGVGVWAASTLGAVNVTTGNVTTNGSNTGTLPNLFPVYGVYGQGAGVTINTTGGTVTMNGATPGIGVYGLSSGIVDIRTGSVAISGNNAGGFFLPVTGVFGTTSGVGANGAVTVNTTAGSISLTGTTATSHGVSATSNAIAGSGGGGIVSVTTANVSTAAGGAHGVNASTTGFGANGAVLVDTTAGLITTSGAAARGINASNLATTNGGLVTIKAGGVTTTGTGASHAIFASSTSGAVSVTAGSLSTAGDGAYGVTGTAAGAFDVTAASVTTTGNQANGIHFDRTGTGSTTVNAGTITTSGQNAGGIKVYSGFNTGTGGAITVTANAITTTGDTVPTVGNNYAFGVASDGIAILTEGAGANGRVIVDTSVGTTPGTLGTVNVSGYKASGISVISGDLENQVLIGGGQVDITAGDVTVSGNYGVGIEVRNYATSFGININVLGTVTTSGDLAPSGTDPSPNQGATAPIGINAWSLGGGDITITTRDVKTSGFAAGGINAQSDGGNVTIDTTAGTIHTSAMGIVATYGSSTGATPVSKAMKVTTADIITEGNAGIGVHAQAAGPNASITIDTTAGTITTKGSTAAGISAVTGGVLNPINTVPITIRTGALRTEGTSSTAINVTAGGGTVDIITFGSITSLQSGGISASNYGPGLTTIDVRGGISSNGGHGIQLDNMFATPGTNVVLVSSAITATGAGIDGITGIVGDTSIIIAPGASVTGTDRAISLATMTNNSSVINNGTLTGNSGVAVEFNGSNTPSAFTNSGTVNGNVLLGGGDDIAILLSGSTINGVLNGGTGTDTLRFAGSGLGTMSIANITNFEIGEKTGTGTWTLTGNSAGAFQIDVQQGRLDVNGTAAGLALMIQNGAFAGGTGSFSSFNALSGATVAPGNSIGTLTVATANFAAGAILENELDSTGATDLLVVTGTATIDPGARVHVIPAIGGAYVVGTEYKILDAGTRVGAFGSVTDTSAFLEFELDQTKAANEVWLRVSGIAALQTVGQTPNQIATATALQELGGTNPLVAPILPLSAADALVAFDMLSGELHASLKATAVEDSRFIREAIVQRTHRIFEDEDALGAWMQAYGAMERRAGDGNAAAIGVGTGGLLFGGDGVGDNGWYVGVVGGIGHTRVEVPDRNSSASSDNAHIAAYATGSLHGVVLRFGTALTQHNIQTTRTPAFAGFGETLTARYDATTAQVFGEIGYPIDVAGLTVEPFVGLAGIVHHSDGFAETGGISALTAPASSYQAAVASVGIRVSDSFVLSNGMAVEAFGSVAWRQAIGSTPTSTHGFAGGQAFTVASAPLDGGALNLELGAGIKFNESTRLDLSYSGQFSGATTSHAAKATLHISF